MAPNKNFSQWNQNRTDHQNSINVFVRLVKCPLIAVKKYQKLGIVLENNFESQILGTNWEVFGLR